ncbi:hypothetical protein AZ041_004284, partial [Escherichia coli]
IDVVTSVIFYFCMIFNVID